MAQIEIEKVLDHLSHDISRALKSTFEEFAPDVDASRQALFRKFLRKVRRKCNTWENIPDDLVEIEE